jgi:hypothetical protein
MIGSRNPAHFSAAPVRSGARFFDSESAASAYHAEAVAAGLKPRTTKLVDHRRNGVPVYSWKVAIIAPTNGA